MKEISCTDMGGGDKCQAKFQGETPEELLAKGNQHIMDDPIHEDLQKEIENYSDEEKAKWMNFYHDLWNKTPDL